MRGLDPIQTSILPAARAGKTRDHPSGARSAGRGTGRIFVSLAVMLAALCLQLASIPRAALAEAAAEEPPKEPADEMWVRPDQSPSEPRPDPEGEGPGLDSLLQLPTDFMSGPSPQVAGASESEWRRRFRNATGELEAARAQLEETKTELDGVAAGGGSGQWSVAPPGGSGEPSDSPLSFKLRQELKRNRERVEAAEKALRELRIEADLAGVPASWRGRELPPQRSLAY